MIHEVLSYTKERQALAHDLVSLGYTRDEITFLLRTADRKVQQLGTRGLNEDGARLGIEQIRAHLLRGLGTMLRRWLPQREGDLGEIVRKPMWGKEEATRREHFFMGMFHALRAGAMSTFYEEGYRLNVEYHPIFPPRSRSALRHRWFYTTDRRA
jgi:hypothetical protein